MARKDDTMPDPMRKRELLYGPKVAGEDPTGLGDRFRGAGRLAEALEFYIRAGDRVRAQGLLQQAVEQGDAFLVERAGAAFPDLVDPDLRRRAARAAEGAGKWRYAATLYEKAGDAELAAQVRARFAPAVEPLDT
ncbi:MAG: hypothetical protein HY722_06035 [Planctomycetes bacterium]|nr:hypothetical protein [Planctomycetota bacterium]